MLSTSLIVVTIFSVALTFPFSEPQYDLDDDTYMHTNNRRATRGEGRVIKHKVEEDQAKYWTDQAQRKLLEQLAKKPITGRAKNAILFMGDGMSIPTLAATRVLLGQQSGNPGEETELSFEKFPFTGLSKTYCVDSQVADSACSATAYLCGVKTNFETIGLAATAQKQSCKDMANTTNHVHSIARWAQLAGKKTGVVTTTRVTHASPTGVYGHTSFRDWESDTDVKNDGEDPTVCHDIAHQLVHGETGRNLDVILGGGRKKFIPVHETDEEGFYGTRSDNRNLIREWKESKKGKKFQYVWNRSSLLNLRSDTEGVLGLMESDHCKYNLDRNKGEEPSLEEMTVAAIKLLSKSDEGYFLFVEGGRIDQAHHDTMTKKALDETIEFAKAVQRAVEITNRKDTLIVVTSDHAHTMTFNGYPERGNDILDVSTMGKDDKPIATLMYANGPSYNLGPDGSRHDVSIDNMRGKNYRFPSGAPLDSETHGGDDVGIFSLGPWAHLLTGVIEQNVIPHVMAYALCVGNGKTVCDES